jgi:hypothetical protein
MPAKSADCVSLIHTSGGKWQSVKQNTGTQSKSVQPQCDLAYQLHDGDIQALTDNISIHFKLVADNLPLLSTCFTSPPPTDYCRSEFVLYQVAVEMTLNRVNIHKAPGPDGLPYWVHCDFCDKLSGTVCAIFNASVREGFMLPCWKEAHVLLIPKVHPSIQKPIQSDLRPISLTSTLEKML